MNDLVALKSKVLAAFDRLAQIRTVDDIERIILQGQGLSPDTYRSYMTHVRSMAEFVGLHISPLEWTAGDIEAFFDHTSQRCGANTAVNYLCGVKNVLKRVSEMFAGVWRSPFEDLSPAAIKKMSRKELNQTKLALSQNEVAALLERLAADGSTSGKQTRAAVLVMLLTGLRAQEACDLTYESLDLDTDSGTWYVSGIGKGGKPYREELHPQAMNAMVDAFRAQHGRAWGAGDYLLHSSNGRMKKAALWIRLHKLGEELKAAGRIRPAVEFSAHLFRRTYCTQLVKLGMPVHQVQEHSRHSNVETLTAHYVDDRASTAPYLDQLLGVAG